MTTIVGPVDHREIPTTVVIGGTASTLYSPLDIGVAGATATNAPIIQSIGQRGFQILNAMDFGAFFDGASHPMSSVYGTVAAAQAVYPWMTITDLTPEMDEFSIQAAINKLVTLGLPGVVSLPRGKGYANKGLVINNLNITIAGHGFGIGTNSTSPAIDAATLMTWNGGSGGTMLFIGPSTTNLPTVTGSCMRGIYQDCAGLAAIGQHWQSAASVVGAEVGVSNSTTHALLTDTTSCSEPGNVQSIRFARVEIDISTTTTGNGIQLDGSAFNFGTTDYANTSNVVFGLTKIALGASGQTGILGVHCDHVYFLENLRIAGVSGSIAVDLRGGTTQNGAYSCFFRLHAPNLASYVRGTTS